MSCRAPSKRIVSVHHLHNSGPAALQLIYRSCNIEANHRSWLTSERRAYPASDSPPQKSSSRSGSALALLLRVRQTRQESKREKESKRGNLDYFMLTIEYNTMDRTQDHGTSFEEEVQQQFLLLNLLSSLLSRNIRKHIIKYNTMDRTQNHVTSVEEEVQQQLLMLNLLSSLLLKTLEKR